MAHNMEESGIQLSLFEKEEDKQALVTFNSNNTSRATLNGFLTMHNRTGLMKSYKSRWFIYSDSAGKLFYYKSRGDTLPEGEIPIHHAIFYFDAKEKPGIFEIRLKDQAYVLEANDKEEMLTWLQELQIRRKEIPKKVKSQPSPRHSETVTPSERRDSAEYVKIEADDIPWITLPESQKGETQSTGAAMSKLSNNVTKAADSARQKFSSMFQRKSQISESSNVCTYCKMMEAQCYEANENARVAREELSANQQVLKLLHNKMDVLQTQIYNLENLKKVYADPHTAAEIERQNEHAKLFHMVADLKKENEKLTAENQALHAELSHLKDCQLMLTETIQAKDSIIMSLSTQVDSIQDDTGHPPQVVKDLINFTEPFHDTLRTKLEAFELQNKFLNKEILELSAVRLDEEKRWNDLYVAHTKLEVDYAKLHGSYLILMNDKNKVTDGVIQENESDTTSHLLDDAIQFEHDKAEFIRSVNSSLRSRQYDAFGFEIEDWSDSSYANRFAQSAVETAEALSLRVKWENFLASLENATTRIHRSVDFKNLVRSGVPNESRAKVWNILVNYHVAKLRDAVGTAYYEKLLKKHSKLKYNPVSKQIEIDLTRTLPNNKYFHDDKSEGIPKLRRVLLAYSYHNTSIGYCQGMNRIAAFALLFLKEEDAFWCLVAIIDFIMPKDYYSTTMIGAQADQRVFRDVLLEKVPRVISHLDAMEIDISLFSFNWFITVFIENIPIPTVLRIWDVFLFEGIKVLFRYACAFFKSAEEKILRCTDYISANTFLREFASKLIDVEKLSYTAFTTLNPFPIRMINSKRAMYLEQVKAELRELNAMRKELKSQRAQIDYNSDLDDEDEN